MTEQESPRAEGKHWVKQEADWSVGSLGASGSLQEGLEEVVSGYSCGASNRNFAEECCQGPTKYRGTLQLDVFEELFSGDC